MSIFCLVSLSVDGPSDQLRMFGAFVFVTNTLVASDLSWFLISGGYTYLSESESPKFTCCCTQQWAFRHKKWNLSKWRNLGYQSAIVSLLSMGSRFDTWMAESHVNGFTTQNILFYVFTSSRCHVDGKNTRRFWMCCQVKSARAKKPRPLVKLVQKSFPLLLNHLYELVENIRMYTFGTLKCEVPLCHGTYTYHRSLMGKNNISRHSPRCRRQQPTVCSQTSPCPLKVCTLNVDCPMPLFEQTYA